jgi:ribosome-binding protein aMBF1 (putative translation factor)
VTPRAILTAVEIGESVLRAKHAAVNFLWRRFGAAVRRERERRGISRSRFASRLGITAAMLGMMESGDRAWQMDRAQKAAKFLTRPEQWPDAGRPRYR